MTDDMRILLLGFFMLILFVPNIVNAQFSSDNFGNDMRDSLSKTGDKIIKLATEMAELMIEGKFTDEEIDEQLRNMDSPVIQESIVEKLKEMGHDYNGEFITAYNNKMKEKEEAKRTSPFNINQEKQEAKMRDADNKLDLNGSELYALHNLVSLDDLLTIENREDLNRIFMQNSVNLNDNSNYPYDDYDHIKNYDEYKEYTQIK
jgi:hypothetical protein